LENENTLKKQVLSRDEAAAYLGIHFNTLDKSDIPRIYVGRRTLFRKETLNKYFAKMERIRRPKCKK